MRFFSFPVVLLAETSLTVIDQKKKKKIGHKSSCSSFWQTRICGDRKRSWSFYYLPCAAEQQDTGLPILTSDPQIMTDCARSPQVWWRQFATDSLYSVTGWNQFGMTEYFSQFQDTTDVLPCHIHLPVCLPIMDPHSRVLKKNASHGNEVPLQDNMHLIQRPCYQRGSPFQDPAGKRTTRRPPDRHIETQTAMVWSCLLFNRSGQSHLARHSEKGKKTRQTEEEGGRQHQGMDRPRVRQVPEGSGEQGKMEETGCEIICGAPTTLTIKG